MSRRAVAWLVLIVAGIGAVVASLLVGEGALDDPEMRSEVLRDHQVHLAAFRYQPDAPPRV